MVGGNCGPVWLPAKGIDITERKAAEEAIRRVALHDPLTGLPNRVLLYEYADHLLPAIRRGHSHAAIFFVDLALLSQKKR